MPDSPTTRDGDITTLTAGQRDWIRREGRVARALEAAQRRGRRRFERNTAEPRSNAEKRPPARPAP
jgi:hypothetical protein